MIDIVKSSLGPGLRIFLVLTVLTGLIYPLAVTGLARTFLPVQAQGSILMVNGRAAGSKLIGQPFVSDGYFHGRPSATAPYPYNAEASLGSNLGPSNPVLLDAVRERVATFRAKDGDRAVPVDLVTASASGLDPHVSPAAAAFQADRVARARGLSEKVVRDLIERHVEGRALGVFGEPTVNVLTLNLELDRLAPLGAADVGK